MSLISNYFKRAQTAERSRLFKEKFIICIGGMLLCAISMSIVSCGKKHDLNPQAESEQVEGDETREEIMAFQRKLSESLNNQDSTFLQQRFNIDRLTEIAYEDLDLSDEEREKLLQGMKISGPALTQQLVSTVVNANTRFIKMVNETKPALLYRLIMDESGFTYVEFYLEKNQHWEIVDLNFYTNGEPTSHLIRKSVAQGTSNKRAGVDEEIIRAIQQANEVATLTNQGQLRKAWDKWKSISPKAHNNRIVLTTGYTAAFRIALSEVGKTENVGSELKEVFAVMSKNFPNDTSFALLELAVHDLNNDYDKFREAVNKIRTKVGNDPYLNIQEAYADLGEEKWAAAIKKAKLTLKEEPELGEPYDVLWAAYLGQKDYKSMADSVREFSALYGVEKSFITSEPSYKEFIDSPEGQAWLNE